MAGRRDESGAARRSSRPGRGRERPNSPPGPTGPGARPASLRVGWARRPRQTKLPARGRPSLWWRCDPSGRDQASAVPRHQRLGQLPVRRLRQASAPPRHDATAAGSARKGFSTARRLVPDESTPPMSTTQRGPAPGGCSGSALAGPELPNEGHRVARRCGTRCLRLSPPASLAPGQSYGCQSGPAAELY